jgi:hypothetical protein
VAVELDEGMEAAMVEAASVREVAGVAVAVAVEESSRPAKSSTPTFFTVLFAPASSYLILPGR